MANWRMVDELKGWVEWGWAGWCAAALVCLALVAPPALAAPGIRDAGPDAPPVTNPGFECQQGYVPQPGINGLVPSGWTASLLDGYPRLDSSRIHFAGSCSSGGFAEHIEGQDSLVFISQDIETPPEPGKPFDALVYQQVPVTAGVAYSLSSWMVSLCGGSAIPNDCPQGYYIAKMLGIDPHGGTDPLAASVLWVEDLRNFTQSGWANLRLGATAQGATVTLFARIRSPFRWHGAHAFVDAYSLVQAPTAHFVGLPSTVQGRQVTVRWDGAQSPDITAIPGGTYQLLFDVQYRPAGVAQWTDWWFGQPAGQAAFTSTVCAATQTIEFRLRARSEQPEGSGGAWPNHRYPGVWSAPASVTFVDTSGCAPRVYLPLVGR